MPETAQKLPEKQEFIAIGLGILLSLALLQFGFPHSKKFIAEDVALGEFTSSYYPHYQGFPVHGRSLSAADDLLQGWEQRGKQPVCLFLANSQIHGINQYKAGQQNVAEMLFKKFLPEKFEFLTFTYPSVTLQENLLLFDYLLPRLKPKALVLPVVFINQRPFEIRDSVLTTLRDEGVRQDLAKFPIGAEILQRYPLTENETVATPEEAQPTFAEMVENTLNELANRFLPFWNERNEMRAFVQINLGRLRNTLLFVSNTTQRGNNPQAYPANIAALRAILELCRQHDVQVLLYIAPLRPSAQLPYVPADYAGLKTTVADLAKEYGAKYLDLDNIVAEQYWGHHLSENFWTATQPDFFHFQEAAHSILAERLEQPVRELMQERN